MRPPHRDLNTPIAHSHSLVLEPDDATRLANLCGHLDEHLKQIERALRVSLHNRGNHFVVRGDSPAVTKAGHLLRQLYAETANGAQLTPEQLHLRLQPSELDLILHDDNEQPLLALNTRKGLVHPRGLRQQQYVRGILDHDISFGVGPAGTGKTWLAVACAVDALEKNLVRRILLVRPAVEAGEKLGFLPGDLTEKINPYLRPLYDALYEMLGFERVSKLLDRQVIEVAPLAYMRGRTLNHSFIILDESQNTTPEQMKMFLTRLGFGSKAVITGDPSQVDLPRGIRSGLHHALDVLQGTRGIAVTRFNARDVVRHSLVQRIVDAYDRHEQKGSHATPENNQPNDGACNDKLPNDKRPDTNPDEH